MKKLFLFIVLTISVCIKANAQFSTGTHHLGPHVWLLNGATILGVDYEYSMSNLGPGKFGVGAYLDYYSQDYGSIMAIGATGLYHFNVNQQFDPFGGLTLYQVNVSYSDGFTTGGVNSGIQWDIYAGTRYFFTPSLALNLTASLRGGFNLRAGVDFKL